MLPGPIPVGRRPSTRSSRVAGSQAQTRNGVEIAVARGQKNDRQRLRQRTQFAAQHKTAVDFIAQADVEQRQIGQPRAHRGERIRAVGVLGDVVAVLFEHVGVVGADDGIVLDNGNAARHAGSS